MTGQTHPEQSASRARYGTPTERDIERAKGLADEISEHSNRPSLSAAAHRIMHALVVEKGLSYVEAIQRAEAQAFAVAAPYHEVADHLRRWLEDHQ